MRSRDLFEYRRRIRLAEVMDGEGRKWERGEGKEKGGKGE